MTAAEINKKITELTASLEGLAEGSDDAKAINEQIAALNADLEALALEKAAAKSKKAKPTGSAFEVEIEGKKVKAIIADVPVIYLSGIGYTVEQFLQDKKLQEQAVKSEHLLIQITK